MINYIIDHAATIATIGFFAAFCLIISVVLNKKNKNKFEDYSKIPMEDEKK